MNRSGERFILTVVGEDHPGIIAGIAGTLYEYECDIQELSQTVLSDEFAMILLLQPTRELDIQELNVSLAERCEALDVNYTLRPVTLVSDSLPATDDCVSSSKDKVIIAVIGADRIGIVAEVTKALADMGINIIELTTAPSYIVHDESQYTMIALVEVDDCVDMPALRSNLENCARNLSVEINVQNQDIFDAMHKI